MTLNFAIPRYLATLDLFPFLKTAWVNKAVTNIVRGKTKASEQNATECNSESYLLLQLHVLAITVFSKVRHRRTLNSVENHWIRASNWQICRKLFFFKFKVVFEFGESEKHIFFPVENETLILIVGWWQRINSFNITLIQLIHKLRSNNLL